MSERVAYTISPLGLLALIAGLVSAAIFPIAILLNANTAGVGAAVLLIAALMVSILVGK
jgi:hypothetical protein